MATKKAATTTKEAKKENKFKECKVSGEIFEYNIRIFPKTAGKGKILNRWYMTIELNNALSIKGCYLTETESNVFITFPQYSDKDGKWNSYFYQSEELKKELDNVVSKLMKLVGIDGDEIATDGDSNLPF